MTELTDFSDDITAACNDYLQAIRDVFEDSSQGDMMSFMDHIDFDYSPIMALNDDDEQFFAMRQVFHMAVHQHFLDVMAANQTAVRQRLRDLWRDM